MYLSMQSGPDTVRHSEHQSEDFPFPVLKLREIEVSMLLLQCIFTSSDNFLSRIINLFLLRASRKLKSQN